MTSWNVNFIQNEDDNGMELTFVLWTSKNWVGLWVKTMRLVFQFFDKCWNFSVKYSVDATSLYGITPHYLCDLLFLYQLNRAGLTSSKAKLLTIHIHVGLKSIGDLFQELAPNFGNILQSTSGMAHHSPFFRNFLFIPPKQISYSCATL